VLETSAKFPVKKTSAKLPQNRHEHNLSNTSGNKSVANHRMLFKKLAITNEIDAGNDAFN
jgi:hypothetical protein